MGGCSSCEVKAATATGKVILEDGRLMEFFAPLKAWQILAKNPGLFICDADDIDFEDYVREIGEEEDLRPGQIYFLLPRSTLRRRLRLEEMVALAVKASAALVRSGCAAALRDCVANDEDDERRRREIAVDRMAGRLSGKRSFVSRLGAIPEASAHDWSI